MNMVFDKDLLDRRIVVDESHRWQKNRWITEAQLEKIVAQFGLEPRATSPAMQLGICAAATLIFLGAFGIACLALKIFWFAAILTSAGGVFYLERHLAHDARKYFSAISTVTCWLSCCFALLAIALFFHFKSMDFFPAAALVTWAFGRRYLSKVAAAACLCFLVVTMIYIASKKHLPPLLILLMTLSFFEDVQKIVETHST